MLRSKRRRDDHRDDRRDEHLDGEGDAAVTGLRRRRALVAAERYPGDAAAEVRQRLEREHWSPAGHGLFTAVTIAASVVAIFVLVRPRPGGAPTPVAIRADAGSGTSSRPDIHFELPARPASLTLSLAGTPTPSLGRARAAGFAALQRVRPPSARNPGEED